MNTVEQHCPRDGTLLDDENWCEECQEQITDIEIAEHEAMWGEVWQPMR